LPPYSRRSLTLGTSPIETTIPRVVAVDELLALLVSIPAPVVVIMLIAAATATLRERIHW
jgi:hypothetical protein